MPKCGFERMMGRRSPLKVHQMDMQELMEKKNLQKENRCLEIVAWYTRRQGDGNISGKSSQGVVGIGIKTAYEKKDRGIWG